MAARRLSLLRRRAGLIDIGILRDPLAKTYDIKASYAFDTSTATIVTIGMDGARSKTVTDDQARPGDNSNRAWTRLVFNPADYKISSVAIDDTKPLWIQFTQTNFDTSTTTSPLQLILPYSTIQNRMVVLNGTAPNVVSQATATHLLMPQVCDGLQLSNTGAVDLYISFELNGPEFQLAAQTNQFTPFSVNYPSFTEIWVRGSGSTCTFSAAFALRNNHLG